MDSTLARRATQNNPRLAIARKKEKMLPRFARIEAGAKKALIRESFTLLVRVSRFNPPNAAEACQLATGLNRRKPSVRIIFVDSSSLHKRVDKLV